MNRKAIVPAPTFRPGIALWLAGMIGVLFGCLFWNHDLEAAMIAHALTQTTAVLVALTPVVS